MPPMRENDDLTDIPPIVPSRDDVDSHRQTRKLQAQEIVRPGYYTEKVKVSTWPVRIMLSLLTLVALGGAGAAYYFYDQLYTQEARQTDLRLADLEHRLALVGDSAEETTLNIQETLDFHFSEIDKLWAARNRTNEMVENARSDIAKLVLVNQGQDEAVANASKELAGNGEKVNAVTTRLNTLVTEFDQLNRSVAALNASMAGFQTLRADMESIKKELSSGDSTVLGLMGRLEYMEESMESVNAHRLQINQSLLRLQEEVDSLQSTVNPSAVVK